ncbi:MAG: Rpn family recombination-promoting nuclease/putative transposase [Prevotellaceae bacterium]|jgi:predicted transposase/invertase (TIGR01784 family)|nr:Rpn family recombination-promoting nuclease/putative transposase [Prevotellaceae bacterium]
MTHYLDPKNDLIFKRIFGEHKHLCISLLNNMLPLEPAHQIVELEYLPPELTPELPVLKNSLVDVRCIDKRGRQFLVEMQMHWTETFKSRVLFNASKAYIKQLEPREQYKFLQPVYALSFVNEIFDHSSAEYYHHYKIVNIADTQKRIEGLEFVFIELPKFTPDSRAEKKLYNLWLTFLTQPNEHNEAPAALLEEELTREALQCLERWSYSAEDLEIYDLCWDAVRTQQMYVIDALDKGEAIGLQKGKEEGRAEGEAIGLQKGRAEAMREMVLSAHRNGHSVAQIQSFTTLSAAEIENILQQY